MSQNQSTKLTKIFFLFSLVTLLNGCKEPTSKVSEDFSVRSFLSKVLKSHQTCPNEEWKLSNPIKELDREIAYVLYDSVAGGEIKCFIKKEGFKSPTSFINQNSDESTDFLCMNSLGSFNAHDLFVEREVYASVNKHVESIIHDIQVEEPTFRLWSYMILVNMEAMQTKAGVENLAFLLKKLNKDYKDGQDFLSLLLFNHTTDQLNDDEMHILQNRTGRKVVICFLRNEDLCVSN